MIAIDAMGGDKAPNVIIDGIAFFHERFPKEKFLVYGDENVISPLIKKDIISVIELIHTDQYVSPSDKVSNVIRSIKKSSMRLAIEAVAENKADSVVSAGNTGVYMALSKIILKTIPGISRPAIVSQIPSKKGESIMLDLGGNIECNAKNIIDYAIMGEIFARFVLNIDSPSIGILNVGVEEMKGASYLHEAYDFLKNKFPNFYGFIEGNDITNGTVDVIVTDGFTGNIALKTGEGMMELLIDSIKKLFSSSLSSKLVYLLAKPIFQKLKDHFDPRRYNGAIWIGLNGIAVKSHGGTDALGFAYAIEMAYDISNSKINDCIKKSIIENF